MKNVNVLFINQKIEDILNEESYISDMNYYEELYEQEMEVQAWYKECAMVNHSNTMEQYLNNIQ